MAVAASSSLSPARSVESDVGRLFEEHSERLFGYCLRFLGSRSEAEDAVQTTFLYAHRALERGVVPELEYAWLHSIAKNVCRWQLRTLARRGSLTTDLDLDAMPSSTGDEVERRELREDIEEALASLPESQRRALVLREWHGLESHEIASKLGMSTTATYALLTRARRSLASALSATGRRPVLGLDFISLLAKLKALLAGGTAKVVATTIVAGSVAIGGVAIERAVEGGRDSQPATPSIEGRTESPSAPAFSVGAPGSGDLQSGRAGATGAAMSTAGVATTRPPLTGSGAGEPGEIAAGTEHPAEGGPGVIDTEAPSSSPLPVELPRTEDVKAPPTLEVPLVEDLVDDVIDPLLEDPLAAVPPVDVELPVDDVAPPLSDVEEDLENLVENPPLPDVKLPKPKLPLLP